MLPKCQIVYQLLCSKKIWFNIPLYWYPESTSFYSFNSIIINSIFEEQQLYLAWPPLVQWTDSQTKMKLSGQPTKSEMQYNQFSIIEIPSKLLNGFVKDDSRKTKLYSSQNCKLQFFLEHFIHFKLALKNTI